MSLWFCPSCMKHTDFFLDIRCEECRWPDTTPRRDQMRDLAYRVDMAGNRFVPSRSTTSPYDLAGQKEYPGE